jgi:hypothetical protein
MLEQSRISIHCKRQSYSQIKEINIDLVVWVILFMYGICFVLHLYLVEL